MKLEGGEKAMAGDLDGEASTAEAAIASSTAASRCMAAVGADEPNCGSGRLPLHALPCAFPIGHERNSAPQHRARSSSPMASTSDRAT